MKAYWGSGVLTPLILNLYTDWQRLEKDCSMWLVKCDVYYFVALIRSVLAVFFVKNCNYPANFMHVC
jgi:hypothetical protein